jgi:ferric-dicitrate binding protein FerR (iron transport regulator)
MMSSKLNTCRKTLTFALALTLSSFLALPTPLAQAQTAPQIVGDLSVTGEVWVNGASVASGLTILSESRVKTGHHGTAAVKLGKFGRIELASDTEMEMRFTDATIGGNLPAGRVTVSAPAGIAISVVTADGIVFSDGKEETCLTVDVTQGNTRVTATCGQAKIAYRDQVKEVGSGQEVAVGTPSERPAVGGAIPGGGGWGRGGIVGLTVGAAGAGAAGIAAGHNKNKSNKKP